jgi:hypothetical protein
MPDCQESSAEITMKTAALFACLLSLFCPAPSAKADTALTPGKVIRLAFPELPPTLRAVNAPGTKEPTAISVRLPDNYSKDRPFPLFVFLHGGQGSTGSEVDLPMAIVGKDDYVVATFPLFKKEIDREEQWGGVGIDLRDYPAISGAFKAFLDRIRETVPNLDGKTSVLGGYSNGANTLALLLSALDPTTLTSFRRFYFIDAGIDWTAYPRYKTLGSHDILFVVGGGTATPEWWRRYLLSRVAYYKEVAQRYGASRWKFVIVDGADHGDPTKYFPYVQRWAAGKDAAGKGSGAQD